jgi:hypothetical protein
MGKWVFKPWIGGQNTMGSGDNKQSRLESTTEITQNKHVSVLHYFVDDIK